MVMRCSNCLEIIPDLNVPHCQKCKEKKFWFHTPNRCDICGFVFMNLLIHFIDGNNKNDSFSNKVKICRFCHTKIHAGLDRRPRGRPREDEVMPLESDYLTLFIISTYRDIILQRKQRLMREKRDKNKVYL